MSVGHAQQREAVSLLGRDLYPPVQSPDTRVRLEQDLSNAQAAYDADSASADNLIWVGRRLAYLGRYRDAIATFGKGIERFPNDARFYRHRGHRYITVREFDNAIRDLGTAAKLVYEEPDEIEPDGAPNKWNVPTSTLQSNIWYHLALAHYLKHDFARALPAWREALKVSGNDDMKVASVDWLYMTLRRLGREAEARKLLVPIHENMRILENDAYHRRLLMYKGHMEPEELIGEGDDPVQIATYGYGVANWYFYNGQRERAAALFRKLAASANWAPFGVIAAEAELVRIK